MKRTTANATTSRPSPRTSSAPRVVKKRTTKAQQKALTLDESDIAIRAYEIFRARNGEPGDAVSDWLQAERELRATQ